MLDRRSFLRLALRSSAVPFVAPLALACKRQPNQRTQTDEELLVNLADYTIDVISRDFGRVAQKVPRQSFANLSRTGLSTLLTKANAERLPVRVQGNRHTSDGQSLCVGGYTATLENDPSQNIAFGLDETDDTLLVAASTSWQQVSTGLASTTRNIAVYTDNLHTTVGGTLAVGGIGVASIQYGTQIDQLQTFELLTPSGEILTCSAEDNSELFHMAPGAMGSLGWMLNVRLKTVARNQTPRCQTRQPCEDVQELSALIQRIAEGNTWAEELRWNQSVDGGFVSMIRKRADGTGTCDPIRAETDEREIGERANAYLAGFPDVARIWSDFLIPAKRYAEFLTRHAGSWFGQDTGRKTLLGGVAVAGQNQFLLAPNYSLNESMFFSAGVYTFLANQSPAMLEQVHAEYDAMTASCLELGGRVYRHGYSPDSDEFRRDQYGHALDDLRYLSRMVDPNAIAWNGAWGTRDS